MVVLVKVVVFACFLCWTSGSKVEWSEKERLSVEGILLLHMIDGVKKSLSDFRVETRYNLNGTEARLREDTKNHVNGLRAELRAEMKGLETGLRGDILNLETGVKGDIVNLETAVKGDILRLETGLKGDILNLETAVEGDILNLETGLRGDILLLETGLRAEMNRTSKEISDILPHLREYTTSADGRLRSLEAKADQDKGARAFFPHVGDFIGGFFKPRTRTSTPASP